MKYLYWLKMNGKNKTGLKTFIRCAENQKERNVMIRYYNELGYDVHVNIFKYMGIETHKKKKKEYIETDAYFYAGEMHERSKPLIVTRRL